MAETKTKKPGGRPPFYDTPEQLQKAVDKYFKKPTNIRHHYTKDGEIHEEIPIFTVSGLAYALGFCDRQSLYDYNNKSEAFSCIIKRAKLFIESEYETALRDNNVAGAIFALKNMGWRDKQEVEHTGEAVHIEVDFSKMNTEEIAKYILAKLKE